MVVVLVTAYAGLVEIEVSDSPRKLTSKRYSGPILRLAALPQCSLAELRAFGKKPRGIPKWQETDVDGISVFVAPEVPAEGGALTLSLRYRRWPKPKVVSTLATHTELSESVWDVISRAPWPP
jgi:hypothetical protein